MLVPMKNAAIAHVDNVAFLKCPHLRNIQLPVLSVSSASMANVWWGYVLFGCHQQVTRPAFKHTTMESP